MTSVDTIASLERTKRFQNHGVKKKPHWGLTLYHVCKELLQTIALVMAIVLMGIVLFVAGGLIKGLSGVADKVPVSAVTPAPTSREVPTVCLPSRPEYNETLCALQGG